MSNEPFLNTEQTIEKLVMLKEKLKTTSKELTDIKRQISKLEKIANAQKTYSIYPCSPSAVLAANLLREELVDRTEQDAENCKSIKPGLYPFLDMSKLQCFLEVYKDDIERAVIQNRLRAAVSDANKKFLFRKFKVITHSELRTIEVARIK